MELAATIGGRESGGVLLALTAGSFVTGWTGLSGLGLSGLGGVRAGGVRVLLLLCPGGAAALRPPLTVHH